MAVDNKTQFESALLRRLHSLLLQIGDLEGQLNRGPRQIKAGEALVQASQETLDQAKQAVKAATLA